MAINIVTLNTTRFDPRILDLTYHIFLVLHYTQSEDTEHEPDQAENRIA